MVHSLINVQFLKNVIMKKNSNFKVGMVFYGIDKDDDRFANIYAITIKGIEGDKVKYDRKAIGYRDMKGFMFDEKTILLYDKEDDRNVWKDETTTLSQMEKGVFRNVELFKRHRNCIVIN